MQLTGYQEFRFRVGRMHNARAQGEIVDQLKALGTARQDRLRATVQPYAVDGNRGQLAAPSAACLEHDDLNTAQG